MGSNHFSAGVNFIPNIACMIGPALITLAQESSKAPQSSLAVLMAMAALAGMAVMGKKEKRQLRRQAIRQAWQQFWRGKKEKGKGASILLVLLFITAIVAVLWVLWSLGGWFALIGGIVILIAVLAMMGKGN
jgi:hypothetical protein